MTDEEKDAMMLELINSLDKFLDIDPEALTAISVVYFTLGAEAIGISREEIMADSDKLRLLVGSKGTVH